MDFKEMMKETMKVKLFEDNETENVPAPVDVPEVTPELIASLTEQIPELQAVDQMELQKGLEVEMEHLETVGGDIQTVAKIALDHIKEAPEGKSYYDSLEQMEHELAESPAEEEAEHAEGGSEEAGEVSAGEETVETETPKEEEAMESKKSDKKNVKEMEKAAKAVAKEEKK